MRILHFADLHLGKNLSGFSLRDDQAYILDEILNIARREGVDALVLAGDVFDRANPSQEALELFDQFISRLAAETLPLYLVSGNHDSASRLGYGRTLFAQQGIHLGAQIQDQAQVFTLGEGEDRLDLYLLPYSRRYDLRQVLAARETGPDYSQASYQDLMATYLAPSLDRMRRRRAEGIPSMILAHLWLVNRDQDSLVSESEFPSLGMVEQLPLDLFADFDYVALGHLHRPQEVSPRAVYPGSPLAYSASEANQDKRVIIIESQAGQIQWKAQPLQPLYPVRKIQGAFADLLDPVQTPDPEAYIFAELTDNQLVLDASLKLQARYPKLCGLIFSAYAQAAKQASHTAKQAFSAQEFPELFARFFQQETGHALKASQADLVGQVLADLQKGGQA